MGMAEVKRLVDGAPVFDLPDDERVLVARPLSEFLKDTVTIEYVVDDMLVRGYLYSKTGCTGSGKTGVAAVLALAVGIGVKFGPHECNRGPVLYIAGENAADVHNRFLVALEKMKAKVPENIRVIDRSFLLAHRIDELLVIVESLKPTLIIVDTDQAVALSGGAEENSNAERMAHARLLRRLTRASSRPTVVDLCHPVKNATRDDLVPRGGSAFLNEVDGNLRLWRDGDTVELVSDPNKFRGAPVTMSFRIEQVRSERIKDAKGRLIAVPYIVPVSDDEAEHQRRQEWTEENRLIYAMAGEPKGSQSDWARACQWFHEDGAPAKYKVNRLLKRLEKVNPALVRQARNGMWTLTEAGKREAQRP